MSCYTTLVAAKAAGLVETLQGAGPFTVVAGGNLSAMMSGDRIALKDASGGMSYVTIKDVNQSNGVIHVVDHVLLPKM